MKYNVDYVGRSAAEQIAKMAGINRQRSHTLSIRRLHDVVMVPVVGYAGLYENGRAIDYSYFSCAAPMRDTFSVESLKDVPEIKEPVFFLGKFVACWGHCITDHFKFLWPFLDPHRHPELRRCKLVYTMLSTKDKLPANYLHILKSLGIDDSRLLRVDRATILRDCYLADECFSSIKHDVENERRYTAEYCNVVDAVCNYFLSNGDFPKKVYLTKRGWNGWVKGEYGEQYLEEAFKSSGYEIVHPERMPFASFVSMMRHAEVVAATECSCSHNALFMSKGAKLVLLRKYDRVNSYQMAINQVRDLDVCYVDVGKTVMFVDNENRSAGPFFMYVTKQLANFLDVKFYFPVGLFMHYMIRVLTLKGYHFGYNICYRIYKRVIVGWLKVDRWERGKVT